MGREVKSGQYVSRASAASKLSGSCRSCTELSKAVTVGLENCCGGISADVDYWVCECDELIPAGGVLTLDFNTLFSVEGTLLDLATADTITFIQVINNSTTDDVVFAPAAAAGITSGGADDIFLGATGVRIQPGMEYVYAGTRAGQLLTGAADSVDITGTVGERVSYQIGYKAA